MDYTADGNRLERYVEDFFQRSGNTEFPTVRQAARALRLRVADVSELAEDRENLQLTYWNVHKIHAVPAGDWFVETLNPPEAP